MWAGLDFVGLATTPGEQRSPRLILSLQRYLRRDYRVWLGEGFLTRSAGSGRRHRSHLHCGAGFYSQGQDLSIL